MKGTTPQGAQSEQEAAAWVRAMFGRVAHRYDLANHLLSFNIDRCWRAHTVARVQDVLARPQHPAQVQLRAESNAMLLGEELQIHSAFSNLVENAAKYTPSDGSVHIRWLVDEDGGHFSVTDTGIGIASEHIPRLTERFYRVDAGRSRATGGSGLGLAIVKHVLQRHGAQLSIDSQEGHGSTFTCHFPPERLRAALNVASAVAASVP